MPRASALTEAFELLMKWRFTDRINSFTPWAELRAEKAVSLEEYYLKERMGQPGEFPEILLLESCIHAARWLIIASSSFAESGMLETVSDFKIKRSFAPGERADILVNITNKEKSLVNFSCIIRSGDEELVSGNFSFTLHPLHETDSAAERKSLWNELLQTGEVI